VADFVGYFRGFVLKLFSFDGVNPYSETNSLGTLAAPLMDTSAFSGTDCRARAEILPDRLACQRDEGLLRKQRWC
jgi:hypothetical protein